MVQKRSFGEGGVESSELPAREPKRSNAFFSYIRNLTDEPSLQEAASMLEPFLRRLIREEVERVINSPIRSASSSIEPTGLRSLQLHFDDGLPTTLFTGSRIESEDKKAVRVVLRDAFSKKIIGSGQYSSLKVQIVVLDGDFNLDDQEAWPEQEFNNRIAKQREGKRPLLTGDINVVLKDGVGFLGEINFTDNSSWTRSRKFRLAAKAQNCPAEMRIREAVSTAFTVKDHRGESYKKHYPPSSADEVWRLEKIAKDGVSHKRLALRGISSVKEFLRLYVTNPPLLRNIIGVSEKKWEKIITHAMTCMLNDGELYVYEAAGYIKLFFNSIFKLVGAVLDGQNYQSLDELDVFQMAFVEEFKHHAYNNLKDFAPINSQSVFPGLVPLPNQEFDSFNSASSSLLNVLPAEQGQPELQMNHDDRMTLPPYNFAMEDSDQLEASELEDSQTLQDSYTTNNFLGGQYSGDSSWPPGSSSEQLGLADDPVTDDNYRIDASAWQGNGFLATPISQAIDIVSSTFNVHIPRNVMPKARWCKLRAAIKCQILIKHVAARRMSQLLFVNF